MNDATKPERASKSRVCVFPDSAIAATGQEPDAADCRAAAAGILLRLGQDDLLGRIDAPVIGPFFHAMSAAGGALFTNRLPLLFAVGVAIGFARKADGFHRAGRGCGLPGDGRGVRDHVADRARREVDKAGDKPRSISVFAGIIVGLVTAALFDQYHHQEAFLPRLLRRPAFRPDRRVTGVLFLAFAMSYFYPLFDAGPTTGLGEFIGDVPAPWAHLSTAPTATYDPGRPHHIRTRMSGSSTATTRLPTEMSSLVSSLDSPPATRRPESPRGSTRY